MCSPSRSSNSARAGPDALEKLHRRGQELSRSGSDGRHGTILTRERGERRGERGGGKKDHGGHLYDFYAWRNGVRHDRMAEMGASMHFTLAWSLLAAAVAGGELTSSGRGGLHDVADQRQLLIDEAFFDQASNMRLRLHPARKTGETILGPQWPWESATLNWFSLMQDPGVVDRQAKYRMWYECYDVAGWPTGDDTSFCYSESATASIGASRG